MANLQLLWPLDRVGYHLEKIPAGSGHTTAHGHDEYEVVVAESGKKDFGDRMKIDGLWRQLADTTANANGALSFVSRFGFLRSKGRRETVDFICHGIEVMRALNKCIHQEDWPALDLWLRDNADADAIRLHPVFDQREGYPRPDLFFAPNTLMDAIYLQALQDATSGTDLRKCDRPGCPEYVAVGPGTGRKRTGRPAFYCTPKCQKAHQYMRKKGEVK